MRSALCLTILFLSSALIIGCAGGMASSPSQPTQSQAAMPSVALSASSSSVTAGSAVTLSWSSTAANSISFSPAIAAVGTVLPMSGSATVTPSASTTYVATAWNGALSQSASINVTVRQSQSMVAVNMGGPDNYYFTPSPLADSLSLYSLDPSHGALRYLAGSQDTDLFNGNSSQPMFTTADGHWLFLQDQAGDSVEFSLLDPAHFATSRVELSNSTSPAQLVGSDPVANLLLFVLPGAPNANSLLQASFVRSDGGLSVAGGIWQPTGNLAFTAKFDQSGKYFLLGTQMFSIDLTNGMLKLLPAPSTVPNSSNVIGFDQSNTHIIEHATSATPSGYQDRITLWNFDPKTGAITFNNSSTVIPGRVGDFNLFALNNDMLWVLSDGVMTSYSFNPANATLTATGQQFNVAEDFQVPFAFDSLTNTLVEPAAQANQLNSYTVNGLSGASTGAYGPVQAGTAPWTMAIAHIK